MRPTILPLFVATGINITCTNGFSPLGLPQTRKTTALNNGWDEYNKAMAGANTVPAAPAPVAAPVPVATPPVPVVATVAVAPVPVPVPVPAPVVTPVAPILSSDSTRLDDFLIQRAIQQQLYFSAELGNEPMVDWLKRFKSHEHLDSYERGEGVCGFPGTYSATFDQLKITPFTAYLDALGTEPDSNIEVSFVKPQRRLSARERANPYLNKQTPVIEVYNQPIITSNILKQLLTTADALVETWAFHFNEAKRTDLNRVANDRAIKKAMPSSEMMEHAELVKSGETAYSRLTGDEAMPLYNFDCRSCDRFDTLGALSLLLEEVTALTPETAFDVDYLQKEMVEEIEIDERDIDDLLMKRRKARQAHFSRNFIVGDDITKGKAARDAAISFLTTFNSEWIPKLKKGDPRSSLGKSEFRHAPGMKEVRPKDAGVDSEEVFEALWEYGDDGAYKIPGGELIRPSLMGVRLREIRADVAMESLNTLLKIVKPELRAARIKYTDFVPADDDGLGTYERLNLQVEVDGFENRSDGTENDTYSTDAIIAEMWID